MYFLPLVFCYIYFLFCVPANIRLSTTLDEVSVYPIPAALYLVKNLLQVSFSSGLSFSLFCLIFNFLYRFL